MNNTEYSNTMQTYIEKVESALVSYGKQVFREESKVSEAALYSLLSGGKRVRGVLALAFFDMLGGEKEEAALAFAAAVEMVHAYSLIHDDLPCMDDDNTRRGKPACHIAFGEANALLAGDALLTAAFETLCLGGAGAPWVAKAVQTLSAAAGAKGMVYGQELDIFFETKPATASQLETVHKNKTGALISAAAALGCLAAEKDPAGLPQVQKYAANVGLVFQIIDDILDVTIESEALGKPAGSDAEKGKTTFITLYGQEKAFAMAENLTQEAVTGLTSAFGERADFLQTFANQLLTRKA